MNNVVTPFTNAISLWKSLASPYLNPLKSEVSSIFRPEFGDS